MDNPIQLYDPNEVAGQISADMRALPNPNTAAVRTVRRQYTQRLKGAEPRFIFNLAQELINQYDLRWLAYELIQHHKAAFQQLNAAKLEELGQGMNSWDTVDAFARILAGPVWLRGQVADDVIQHWAKSPDVWWRRAALVSTVALNMRSQGGRGDVPRTLAVCRLLVSDHEDMVVKALSWALRELLVHDAVTVEEFLHTHEAELAARVKREVRNKLRTGLKNPKPKTD